MEKSEQVGPTLPNDLTVLFLLCILNNYFFDLTLLDNLINIIQNSKGTKSPHPHSPYLAITVWQFLMCLSRDIYYTYPSKYVYTYIHIHMHLYMFYSFF